MKAKNQPRFDVEMLHERAGAKAYDRGRDYHKSGQVEILVLDPQRVLAQVAGTEDYRAELIGQGKHFTGVCSCPAYGDWGFCKHLVATGLAANEVKDDELDSFDAVGQIREHLKQKGVDALVDMIVKIAEHDAALFRKLHTAASMMNADEKRLGARLRKAVDGATRIRDYVEYGEASDWADQVSSVLDTITGLASGARAGLARELAEHALDRIEEAASSMDDSDGHCGALLHSARDIHLAAVRELRPEPIQLARDLFEREMADDYGIFDGAADLYAEALGEEGLIEYRRLATAAWEKLSTPPGRRLKREAAEQQISGNSDRLMRILDEFAEREGDVDTRIVLRSRELSSQWHYLQLAEFCRSHGREEDAIRHAEEGLWVFEDERPDQRLVFFAADILSTAGRNSDAQQHLQRVFEKQPSLEVYAKLRRLGGEQIRERVVRFLETKQAAGEKIGWIQPSDLQARIWMHENMFDAAWAVVQKHGAPAALKEELSKASEATHPREVLEVYAERVVALVNAGSNSAYAEAAKLVTRMAKLRSKEEQRDYVLALKARFERKRNFMKLLS